MSDKEFVPAFPHEVNLDRVNTHNFHGMSLRDYFAAKAMQGFITNDGGFTLGDGNRERMESASQLFYKMADAMLKARGE